MDTKQVVTTRLSPDQFRTRFGTIYAMSTNGRNLVVSALTKHKYIYWDTPKHRYIVESRY